MKKRLLSAFMALALCLTLVPTAALAEGTAENVAEVTIGSATTQYDDIDAAFAAAQQAGSATVKLLANVTTTSEIKVVSGTFTIDLNGRKWEGTDTHTLLVSGGNVTVTSTDGVGTITCSSHNAIYVDSGATVHVKSGVRLNQLYTMKNAKLTLDVGVIITVKFFTQADNIAPFLTGKALQRCDENGTLIEGQYKSIYDSYRTDGTGCVIVIEHKSCTGTPSTAPPCPICGYDGTQTKPTEPVDPNPDVAEVNGTKYKTLAEAIKAANGADITLLTIVSENVVVDGASIKAGIILGNGETIDDIPYPSNWVADRNDIPLTMEAGEITLKDGALAQFSASSSANVAIALKGGTLIVETTVTKIIGSNRSDSVQHAAIEATGGVLDLQGNTLLDGGLTMSGDARLKNKLTAGTFTNSGSETYSVSVEGSSQYGAVFDLLETGYAFAEYDKNAENKVGAIVDGSVKQLTEDVIVVAHTHSIEEGQSACACGKQFEAGIPAVDGTITYYETIDEAFANVKANETVKLMINSDDRSRFNTIYVVGGPYTFDLNGHRVGHWTGDDDFNQAFLQVGDPDGNPGTLTVLDSSAAQTGYFYELELYNGDLTVESGSFYRYWESATTATGTMTFKGGTVDVFTVTSRNVETKISGGTFGLVENNIGGKPGDLLADNRAFFNRNNGNFVNGYDDNYSAVRDVVVKNHTHNIVDGSCECGFTCAHNDFKDGKCTICGNGCAHTNVDENGLCRNCKTQMAVKSETGGTVTYGTDFKAAMNAAVDGTTVTLLADIEWGVTPQDRAAITGDGKIVTLNLNGHTITGGWFDIGSYDSPTSCTLKIIGEGSHESLRGSGGYNGVSPKATLDLSEWKGGTINAINISDNSKYDETTREAAVIVGPKAGTIGKLSFGNNQLKELKKTKLSGGSFNEIWVADFGPVKLGELLAEGYAYQYTDGVDRFVEYTKTLQGASISNVKVVKCLHPNMKPDENGVATCEYCGKSGKFVASVDGNLYTDMDAAITYWLAKGGTLKLYTDYTAATEKATWTIVSGEHSIDLNGHSMFVQDDGAFKPTNNMHLTVTDDTERGQIENILLDGSQRGSFTLESGYVCNLEMTGGAVVALKGGSVDNLDVQNCSASTNLSIQGGSLGKLNITDWADGMHVSATGGSLGAYNLPSGKILADVLDHQYYAEGTSLDRQVDTAQLGEKFVIKHAPYDFGSTSKAANVPINGSIPFRVDSPSENVGVYDVKWYRRTDSGAEHMVENRVADVNVNDKLDVFCVITGVDKPNGAMQWQVAVKDYTIKVVPADLSQGAVVFTQTAEEFAGTMGNIGDGKGTFVFEPYDGNADSPTKLSYLFKVTYNGQPLKLDKDYTIKDSSNRARNAGTHTLTIEGKGNYTGTATHQWEIKPYTLSKKFDVTRIVRNYDGTTNLSAEELIELGCFIENRNSKNPSLGADLSRITIRLGAEDFEVSNVKLGSAEAGDTTASFTIKLKPRPGQTAANFVFEDGTSEMTVKEVPVSTRKAFLSSSPEAGKLNVANDHAGVYTLDLSALLPKLESPKKYGEVTYEISEIKLDGRYYTSGAKVENGKLILPIQAVNTSEENNIGTVKVKVTSGNIVDFPLLINVDATNKIIPTGEPTLSAKTLTYGQALSAIKLSGKLHDNVNNKDVEGTFTWADSTVKPGAGSYKAAWKFTPTDGDTYAETTGTVSITVNKAKPTGDPIYTRITAANKMLKDAALKPNTSWPTGTIQWVDKDGKELENTTEVKANTAYKWIFTPTGADADNYTTAEGTVILYSVSTGGGGGSSSSDRDTSSSGTVKTETTKNNDGSVTKTETKKDGTKVETTTGKDGSVSKTTTNPNGSSVTETKAADGSTGTVKTDKNGQTTAETKVSAKAVEDAKKNGEAVKAPVEVKATRDSDTAPTVKIELPRNSGDTKVEIPVTNVKPGTVAVLVHPDGTEEIVKNSLPTEDGIQLTVNGGATVKIVDNSKDFIDTRNHWAKDAIDFVSARGLVNGMSATIYAPNASTTRAQLWTILARQNDADLNGGNTWFENAQNWAKEKGISDGANPNGTINRAQMVTMLWRAMGQPAAGGSASFADVPADSYYAQAVAWAIENGITAGVGGGHFDPNSTCTRGQIATFLYRYMK